MQKQSFKELGLGWIGIELTNACNIRCTFCPLSYQELTRKINQPFMPYELAKKIIKEVIEDGTLQYVILNNYGEPLIYPRFADVLELCSTNKIKVRFGTNGTLFFKKNIEAIKKYCPDEMVISIQYFLRKNYRKVKGTDIDYDEWLNQIAGFLTEIIRDKIDTKIQLAIACNYNNRLRNTILGLRTGDKNLPYPDKFFFYKLNNFIKDFCENRLGIQFDENKINIKRTRQLYDIYYPINERISFELKNFFDSIHFYKFKENKTVNCYMPYLNITTNGETLMCCADYIEETSLGNVKNRKIAEILMDKRDIFLNKNSEKSKIKLCRKCKGERTKRGLLIKNVARAAGRAKQGIKNFLKQGENL